MNSNGSFNGFLGFLEKKLERTLLGFWEYDLVNYEGKGDIRWLSRCNLPKRVMGYLYNNFGIGRVPKIPLIKIGGRINCKGIRPGRRRVSLNTGREGARIDDALFLASKN